MCLGSEADKPIDTRKQMFAPFYMLEAAKKATIVVGDSVRPLILHEKKVVDVEPEDVREGFPLSPMVCVFILIGVTCFVGWLQFKIRKIIWIWDLLLFGVQGLAGCVITFLVFFFYSSYGRVQLAYPFIESYPFNLSSGYGLSSYKR